jgi:G6PDH family F420-dependent oxidoreductase
MADPDFELGYWLAGEEHGPRELVACAAAAEQHGFRSAMVSDHFHPWVRAQGQSPFVWSVIGGIATATGLRVGTGVTAPIIRLHPAIVAHAAATAASMLDGRFFLGVGTGERLNEHVTGERWPGATERRDMLEEAVTVIRRLLEGGNVNHRGDYYRVENAQLYTRPAQPPPLMLAAGGPASAQQAGRIGDGLIGVAPDPSIVETFESAGGHGKPRLAELHLCWAESEDEARKTVERMSPNSALRGAALTDLARPQDFEEALSSVPEGTAAESMVCGPDPERHLEAIGRFAAAGFTEVYLHQVGPDQLGFLRFCKEHILPRFS